MDIEKYKIEKSKDYKKFSPMKATDLAYRAGFQAVIQLELPIKFYQWHTSKYWCDGINFIPHDEPVTERNKKSLQKIYSEFIKTFEL